MPNKFYPEINNWYRDLVEDHLFKVVAYESDDDSIEIQFFDGDIEEIDLETWHSMMLVAAQEPEDWTGPFDDLVADDMGDIDTPMHPQNWSDPLNELD